MLKVSEYNLPDIQLLEKDETRMLVWIPDKTYIVLGASNNVNDALIVENVEKDNIEVQKRPSGGQTVMVTPNNLVISAVITDERTAQPKEIFKKFNDFIISILEKNGAGQLSTRGISDIAIGEKKIMGSSMYQRKGKILYHAVLNYGEIPATFEKYLKHPSKEPDYRQGRSHSEFVTSLKEQNYSQSMHDLEANLSEYIGEKMNAE